VKTGAALIVKGTQALHRPDTGGFQRDILADNVGDVYPLAHLVNVGAPDSSSHPASLVRARIRPEDSSP